MVCSLIFFKLQSHCDLFSALVTVLRAQWFCSGFTVQSHVRHGSSVSSLPISGAFNVGFPRGLPEGHT